MAFVSIATDALTVTDIFASPQDPDDHPGFAEVDDDDPRLLAFLAILKPTIVPIS
jgi:hypothetical protein